MLDPNRAKEIMVAISTKQLEKLPELFQGVDAQDAWRFLAVVKNDDETALKLAKIIEDAGGNSKSPEALFLSLNQPVVLKKFLADGADPNTVDRSGNWLPNTTPVLIAADNGLTESVKYLVEAGADVNHRDNNMGSALLYACDHGYKDIAEALLDAGANVDVVDKTNRTPLELASQNKSMNTDPEFMKQLQTPAALEINKLKIEKTAITEEMISALPAQLSQHKEFIAWLKTTGILHLRQGSSKLSSIDPKEYEEEMKSLFSWNKFPQVYVPVAGPGANDWCIVYNLDDNKLYDWWHEESEKFTQLNDPLEKVLIDKLKFE